MMRPLLVAAALCLVWWNTAAALDKPQGSEDDYRVKHAVYKADQVYLLNAVIGIATHIIVGDGETYVTHAFGDPAGWEFAHKDRHYFVKAKAENSDTSLTVVTNKRSYNFALHFIGDLEKKEKDGTITQVGIKTPWALNEATFQIAFSYPEEEQKQQSEVQSQQNIQDRFNTRGGYHNMNYTMSATAPDMDIVPLNVWDDGRFTYFKFAPNTKLPNIYSVAANGSETAAKRHMTQDSDHIIVAEEIAQRWYLRSDDLVIGVFNESFDPAGLPNRTGTASPDVKRVLKGDKQ